MKNSYLINTFPRGNIDVIQAEEDADVLIVNTAKENVDKVGQGVDIFVISWILLKE